MTSGIFTALFLAAVAGELILRFWLVGRNVAHVRAHSGRVPEPFQDSITPEAHRKAADYTVARSRLNLVAIAYGTAILLAWTLGGGLDALDGWLRLHIGDEVWRGIAVIFAALFITSLLDLPLSVYATFVIEERYGFNRTTPAVFAADLAKSALISIVLGVPLLYAILWTVDAAGAGWWMWAWAIWVAASVLQTWAYPRLIAPLFNKFTPLTDVALKERVERLAKATGFAVKDMFVMDGSRRSAHGNAYMTGLGRNKRIVFFDTLLAALDAPQVEAVLAHEIGHYRLRHVQKMLAASALVTFAGWALLGLLARSEWFFSGLGVSAASPYMALLLFVMVGPVFAIYLRPLVSFVSRRFEFQADDYAAEFSDAAALTAGLKKLYRDNANTLTPDPLYSAVFHSHPPPLTRIRHLAEIAPAPAGAGAQTPAQR
ncbi:MAG: M48 family metallopeptidase [Alphaproteobacteria bacterium]